MTTRRLRAFALAGLIVAAMASVAVAAPGGTSTGPNTTTKPYVLPVGDGVSVKSLLTVGDGAAATNSYPMVGIPDGLGLVRSEQGDHDFRLFMNHELRASQEAAEARMGTSVMSMAEHYRDSVQMIADIRPGSTFLSALRLELDRLESIAA